MDNDDTFMDCTNAGDADQPPTTSTAPAADVAMTSSMDESEIQLTLSLKWSGSVPDKWKKHLEQMLQTYFNSCKPQLDCEIIKPLSEQCVEIKIKPPPAWSVLQKLNGQKLTPKDQKYSWAVTIVSISLAATTDTVDTKEMDTKMSEDASVNHPTSMPVQQRGSLQANKPNTGPTAEDKYSCPVPVVQFYYVNHIYKDNIEDIEKKNGVKMNVIVSFQPNQRNGNPENALSEFTDLFQDALGKLSVRELPLNDMEPEQLSSALKLVQNKENKLLLTLASKNTMVCGPTPSQEAIIKALFTTQSAYTCPTEYERKPQDTPLKITMPVRDPLVDSGITVEEDFWKIINTSYSQSVEEIKTNFNVNFKEVNIGQGKVNVKVSYKSSDGNPSMESHAIRALLRLCQKILTSPMSFTQPSGASHFAINQSEGASNISALNGHSSSMSNTEEAGEGGATAKDNEEDTCPICMDKFQNKKKLKCKHEFCEECLERAKKTNGSICPVCREVFGKIIGNQPDGTMTWSSSPLTPEGFPGCGSIVINYNLLSGRQTDKHPNPGQSYSGISRTAYLPDNKEGREVVKLLKRAFDQKLIFTIGTSRTTGLDNQVTWNDIHHKTSLSGGPQRFGYPDPDYLSRVREELKAKGIS
ncbi:E3 ubiquitin-protein ligase DTX3L-like isoform 2-T2 [Pholidichthys leucotaenia]